MNMPERSPPLTPPPQPAASTLLTSREVAQWLAMSESRLSQLRFHGQGPPFIRIGQRGVRYQRSAVENWLAAQTIQKTVTQ
jgi:predicted DNA-binding transcriptional regulator AlpA